VVAVRRDIRRVWSLNRLFGSRLVNISFFGVLNETCLNEEKMRLGGDWSWGSGCENEKETI